MSLAFYLTSLLVGVIAGWNAALLRGSAAAPGPAGPVRPRPAPAPFDWRDDPVIAGCAICHGIGRLPTFRGRFERCPCGAGHGHVA